MSLACEDELDRPVGVEQQVAQSVGLREQEGCALVGGETAGKADRQRGWVEERPMLVVRRIRLAARAVLDPSQIRVGLDPSQIRVGIDPSQIRVGLDPSQIRVPR